MYPPVCSMYLHNKYLIVLKNIYNLYIPSQEKILYINRVGILTIENKLHEITYNVPNFIFYWICFNNVK